MKKWKRSGKAIGLTLLALTLMIVAGCQALGGVDFNEMLKQSVKVSSMESKQNIEFKLLLADGALDGEDEELTTLVKWISQINLELDDIKMSEGGNISLNGKLILNGKSIGFSLKANDKLLELNLEGVKKPVVIRLDDELLGGLYADDLYPGNDGTAEDKEAMTKTAKQIVDIVSGYAINNLPNPSKLTVEAGQEPVNGESVAGMRIHAELNGPELWDWAGKYVDALLNDKEGLNAMIAALFDALEEQTDLVGSVAGESIFGTLPKEDEKQAAVEEASESIASFLTEMREGMNESDPQSVNEILNEKTYIKIDLFVDSKLDIRKSTVEASIVPQFDDSAAAAAETDELTSMGDELSDSPFEGIWIKLSGETWNVNGAVTPEVPVDSPKALHETDLDAMEGYQLLRQLESNSTLYGLLRNDLEINKQSVQFNADYSSNPVIRTPAGVTIIPLRETVEQLGATLTKDAATGKITIYDDATYTTLVLKAGSNQAVVNGKTLKWAFPTTVVQGVTYVSARDLVKALGGELEWQDWYETNDTLVINRQP
ncbi:copper amine oxidase N-terminal domain-containing protein [Paenibacillus nasutitermitis]|uniref:copper amine oxidase N-terminal domain-containing protein n=1 Tax=Paenibacillus nasutitermitis TaxID=1652958 RepID=UPI001663230B|nr:copper amine oxidase N-terminal domain-containing protein [Paenibacillus nasutitermitis]